MDPLQDQQVSKELIAIIAVLITMLNQAFSIIRGKVEKSFEAKNGGGIPKKLEKLRDEQIEFKSDLRIWKLERDQHYKDVMEILEDTKELLDDWNLKLATNKLGCQYSPPKD